MDIGWVGCIGTRTKVHDGLPRRDGTCRFHVHVDVLVRKQGRIHDIGHGRRIVDKKSVHSVHLFFLWGADHDVVVAVVAVLNPVKTHHDHLVFPLCLKHHLGRFGIIPNIGFGRGRRIAPAVGRPTHDDHLVDPVGNPRFECHG
eukprot:scaffold16111_cov172-Amphora_coffeaeformis.AAC.7